MKLSGDPNLPGGMTAASFDRYFPETPDDCEQCHGTGRQCGICCEGVPANAEQCAHCPSEEIGDCSECNGTGRQKTAAEHRREWEEDKADLER